MINMLSNTRTGASLMGAALWCECNTSHFYPTIPLVSNIGDNNIANYMSYKPRLYNPSAPYTLINSSFNSQCNDSKRSISGSFFDTSLVNGCCISLSPGSGFTEAGCTNTRTFDISAFNYTQVSFL
jgi:hypothetical protein